MKKVTLMTEGNIWKHLILFAIPLILGNLLQQLYNTVDSIIVGNSIGSEALAAVGTTGSVINLLVGFLMGTSSGAGVVIAQYYGARDGDKVKRAVHTTMALAMVTGIVLTILGIAVAPLILRLLGTPEEVLDKAVLYLKIFFGGILFSVLYNMSAGILNAVGNSRRSLLYLAIGAGSNIVLDLLFVLVFHLGIAGVALATDISQMVSCILILRFLTRSRESYKVSLKEIRFHRLELGRIIKIGVPGGIQNMVVSFSNVIVQSGVNSFGTYAIAGVGAYMKVDGFNILPVSSFSMAATTFAGQNYGAKKYDRVMKGFKISIAVGVLYALITGSLLLALDTQILSVFTADWQVVDYGVQMLHYFCPFYFLLSTLHIAAGTIRGTGKTVQPMLIIMASLCILRIVWIQAALSMAHDIRGVFMSYPVSWAAGAAMMLLYAWKGKWFVRQEA